MGSVTVTSAGDKTAVAAYTWATKPSAASAIPGTAIRVTDVGINGSLWHSNGTAWFHESPIVLAQTGIPMILPSSGSIGNNGALTGITALPATYSGGCYMYFPANAIAAGVAAGLYYVVMSSTTAGTIYNNTYTSGIQTIPASPTAFATTGPGAYTQTTGADITLFSLPILGNLMGSNGTIRYNADFGIISNTNTRTVRVKFAGNNINSTSITTTGLHYFIANWIKTQVSTSSIYASSNTFAALGGTQTSVETAMYTVDTMSDQNLTAIAQLSVATDYIMLRAIDVVVQPS